MLYRPYGRTGHKISALAMGGMRFEAPADIERMAEIAVYLYDRGVNYFDTAPDYCDDKSEEIVGAAVKEMKKRPCPEVNRAVGNAQRFFVATKTFAGTEKEIRQELERSLKRLNVECIDFYHVWCVRSWAEWLQRKGQGVVAAFRKMKDEGLVRHIAASIHLSSADIKRLVKEGVFEGFTVGFCAANFAYREAGLRAASRAGLGLVVMNPFAGGAYWQAPDRFEFLKTHAGDDLVRGGLRFVLSHREITAALVGVRNLSDAQSALRAAQDLELLSSRKLSALKARARSALAALCTCCDYCRDCPADLPVSRLMDAYNYIEFGQTKAVYGRLRYHWGVEDLPALLDKCTGCAQCEQACTQRLPIRERLAKLRATWDEIAAERARQKK